MKITKTALTILAIAISSSAFAATSSEGQGISEKIKYSFLGSGATYEVNLPVAGQNIYEGARGENVRQAFRSVDDAFYAGIKKSINDYEADRILANQLAVTEPSANIIFGTKGQPASILEIVNRIIERKNAESLQSSLAFALSEKAKQGFLGTRSADLDISTYSNTKESTARALNGTLFFTQANSDRGVFGYTTQIGNVDGESLNESLPVESAIRDGATKAVAEFKAKENAKAISEFNALQELAVKESNPAVKSLIEKAADLKLASYREAATN